MNKKDEYQSDEWKKRADEIRALDHHQCAMCGAKRVMLHVHHLSYPPPPFHIWDAYDNELITLCKECHAQVHQSTKRPTLDAERKLHIFDSCHHTKYEKCHRCKYYNQLDMLSNTEEQCFELNGRCKEFDGEGCCFQEYKKCKGCAFLYSGLALWCNSQYIAGENGIACSCYLESQCQNCKHFEGDFCDYLYESVCWHDDDELCTEKIGESCFEVKPQLLEKYRKEMAEKHPVPNTDKLNPAPNSMVETPKKNKESRAAVGTFATVGPFSIKARLALAKDDKNNNR
jgi:hypothetical protein